MSKVAVLVASLVLIFAPPGAFADRNTISGKADDNSNLKLSNGLIFPIDETYRYTVSMWHVGDRVSFDDGSGVCSGREWLRNDTQKEQICVNTSEASSKKHGNAVSVAVVQTET